MISVVITTRDRRALLAQSLGSVLAQDWTDLEVVVVDDAGTDDTLAWLGAQPDDRVRAVRLAERGGFGEARNTGLELARGEFVLFLDDDDLLLPQALRRLATALAEHPSAVAATGVELAFDGVDHEDRWLNCVRPRRRMLRPVWPDVLAGLWITGAGRTLFRTSTLRQAGGWNPAVLLGEDDELWLRLAPHGRVLLLPDDVLLYRDHTNRRPTADALAGERDFRHRFVARAGGRSRRLLRAWEHVTAAGQAMAADRAGRAARCYAAALCRAPELLLSPLSRPALLPALGSALAAWLCSAAGRVWRLRRAVSHSPGRHRDPPA